MKKPKSKTVTFEQVEPNMHNWANFFSYGRYDPWELINSAWAYGGISRLTQDKIKFASERIRLDMIDCIRRETKNRRRVYNLKKNNRFPKIRNITVQDGNGQDRRPLVEVLPAPLVDNIIQKDFIKYVIKRLCYTRMEKLIMNLMYVDGYNQDETAKVCGIAPSMVSLKNTNLMRRLKTIDFSRAI